ncbi:WD repeat-containing protein 18 [Plodia interpunctella]|uniref:WD repeat-containing protein 18 n=1 Tax=Plodia interpunctella TaxID=58824 RepID=UPI002367F1F2|nr:WD repeat-containing protein 18 [Plodia interpunctella]
MSSLLEVLVTCDSNNTLWTCSVWDPHTGCSLMTYKGGGTAETRTLSYIGDDYVAAVEKTKPVLHIWPLNSHQTVQGMRFILPGKASALAVTRDGSYIVAGIDEKIYLWQIASGNLLTIINRHYQKVGVIKFTPDGRFFVSAAEDGMVMVWSLATVAANPEVEHVSQAKAGQHDPVYIFSDHSLPITDLCISKTGMHGRLFTVSIDRTCKIYDLSSGELLLNLVFDIPLTSVVLDVLELNIFVGTTEGKIHQCSLTNPPRSRDMLLNTDSDCSTFAGHIKVVTCLSVSLDGETLMSGSNDEQVILWHLRSRQPIRTIRHKGPVTNAFFAVNYPAMFQTVFSPSVILHSLERTLEKDSDDVTEIEVLTKKKISFWPDIQQDEIYSSYPSREIEVEFKHKELALKEELDNLKKVNASLYSFSIQRALNSISGGNNQGSDQGLNKKKKKK